MKNIDSDKCDLCDPEKAREFVLTFKVNGNSPTYVKFSTGRTVYFNNMSDEDAVKIAHEFYEMEKEAGHHEDLQ